MRVDRFLVLICIVVFAACKTTSVSTTKDSYQEDLSYLRPELTSGEEENVAEPVPVVQAGSPNYQGHIKAELDSVNSLIVEQNKRSRTVDGYTIQIYSGNDREKAIEARGKIYMLFPDLTPKIEYDQPSYKVTAGQYSNRLKAHKIFESLKSEFPLALLIPERILLDYD